REPHHGESDPKGAEVAVADDEDREPTSVRFTFAMTPSLHQGRLDEERRTGQKPSTILRKALEFYLGQGPGRPASPDVESADPPACASCWPSGWAPTCPRWSARCCWRTSTASSSRPRPTSRSSATPTGACQTSRPAS